MYFDDKRPRVIFASYIRIQLVCSAVIWHDDEFLRSKISELCISFEFLVFDFRSWLTNIENTKWLHHISGLLKASLIVVNAIDKEHRCVLVHCSDGWDRTPQIVALAELMLDPFYRTLEVSW